MFGRWTFPIYSGAFRDSAELPEANAATRRSIAYRQFVQKLLAGSLTQANSKIAAKKELFSCNGCKAMATLSKQEPRKKRNNVLILFLKPITLRFVPSALASISALKFEATTKGHFRNGRHRGGVKWKGEL